MKKVYVLMHSSEIYDRDHCDCDDIIIFDTSYPICLGLFNDLDSAKKYAEKKFNLAGKLWKESKEENGDKCWYTTDYDYDYLYDNVVNKMITDDDYPEDGDRSNYIQIQEVELDTED